RPENAFILFRMNMCTQINATKPEGSKPNREADLSKTISKHWKELSPEEKQVWKDMAAEKKREHQQQYPNYKYRP
ncbi:high mobility group box, partial [Cylindrobasidium torrendii FP15055 ss-10]